MLATPATTSIHRSSFTNHRSTRTNLPLSLCLFAALASQAMIASAARAAVPPDTVVVRVALPAQGPVGEPGRAGPPAGPDAHSRQVAAMQALEARLATRPGLEVWSHHVEPDGTVLVRTPRSELAWFEGAGLRYTVEIADLAAHYAEIFAGPTSGGGFFEKFQSYDAHVAFLQEKVAMYPDLCQMIDIGQSVEGRTLWVLRISGSGPEPKAAVLYHGGQHGNEIIGPAAIAYLIDHLLVNYGVDPNVTAMVDGLEWFLMPIMNPDGYEYGSRYNANGVDLNRNWGGPGSGNGWPDPGPFPFSEPETAAIRDFRDANPNIRAYSDLHSAGYMILWPWGHTPVYSSDHWTFSEVGYGMYDAIIAAGGAAYGQIGPIYMTIYPVSGGSLDYMYGVHSIWSIAFEIGWSQSPGADEIVPRGEEMITALSHLSAWTHDCNGDGVGDEAQVQTGEFSDCNNNGTPDVCEVDDDGDGLPNACHDVDGDGVSDEFDVCSNTPLGYPVNSAGIAVGDVDEDCDLDLVNVATQLECLSDPPTMPESWCEEFANLNGDGQVDMRDVQIIFNGFHVQ